MNFKVTKSMLKARSLLLVLLLFIAKGESHWYTLNGSHNHHSYSLARRLGFFGDEDYYAFLVAAGLAAYQHNKKTDKKQITVLHQQWKDMLLEANNESDSRLFDITPCKFDLHAAANKKVTIDSRKYNYYTIRIGVIKKNESYNKLSAQVRDNAVAPHLPGLRSKQRSFYNDVQRMTCDLMTEDEDFYDVITLQTKENDKLHVDDDEDDNTKSNKRKREEEEEEEEEETPLQYRDKDGKFGEKEAARFLGSLSPSELNLLMTKVVVENTSNDRTLHFRNMKNHKYESYVRVPANESDASFKKCCGWIDSAIQSNAGKAGNVFQSAKRTMKHLHKKFKSASMDALKELRLLPPVKMNEIQQAAMFKAANVSSRRHRRALMRHLRHHFGNVFASERKVEMLCAGHTEVYTGTYKLRSKKKEGASTDIKYSRKNVTHELAAQLTRQLNYRDINDPSRIKRIDVMAGGDHGQGAFIFGAKVVVVLKGEKEGDEDDLFTFSISTAEIQCDHETAEILNNTIKPHLVEELRQIHTKEIFLGLISGDDGKLKIECSYVKNPEVASISIQIELYIVGDLAFYALLLGMDGMSPHHCLLCEMKGSDMKDLNGQADMREYGKMKRLGEAHQRKIASSKTATEPKAELGCKDIPWFDFLRTERFIVPLLHCLIGIGDAILAKFREEVSEKIEYLTPEEVSIRSHLSQLLINQSEIREKRDDWDGGAEGKELKSLQGKRKRAIACLRKLSPSAISKCAAPRSFLEEVMDFIEEGNDDDNDNDNDNDNDETMEGDVDLPVAAATVTAANAEISEKISSIKSKVKELDKSINPLAAARKKITNRLDKNNCYIKKAKDKITQFKSGRKMEEDGVETRLFSILKNFYGVKLQAYHGGSLHGKDHQKVMDNADEIFHSFAGVLKEENKKKGDACVMKDEDIDELCRKYASLYLLWDGAFSYASKINPTLDDIVMYEKFVTAAVHSHIELGMNVTPKVHLMWQHVKHQMAFPGGLGHKREDWVEHQHQITRRLRDQYRTTQDDQIRADAKARRSQQYSHPEVEAWGVYVDEDAKTGPRKDYTKKEELRRERRVKARIEALDVWEAEHPDDQM